VLPNLKSGPPVSITSSFNSSWLEEPNPPELDSIPISTLPGCVVAMVPRLGNIRRAQLLLSPVAGKADDLAMCLARRLFSKQRQEGGGKDRL